MKFRLDNADYCYSYINKRLHDYIIKLKSEGFKIEENNEGAFIYLDSLNDMIKVHNIVGYHLIFEVIDDNDLLLVIYDGYIE